jgi:hypothetical protein
VRFRGVLRRLDEKEIELCPLLYLFVKFAYRKPSMLFTRNMVIAAPVAIGGGGITPSLESALRQFQYPAQNESQC